MPSVQDKRTDILSAILLGFRTGDDEWELLASCETSARPKLVTLSADYDSLISFLFNIIIIIKKNTIIVAFVNSIIIIFIGATEGPSSNQRLFISYLLLAHQN